jgi:hypothetical protein
MAVACDREAVRAQGVCSVWYCLIANSCQGHISCLSVSPVWRPWNLEAACLSGFAMIKWDAVLWGSERQAKRPFLLRKMLLTLTSCGKGRKGRPESYQVEIQLESAELSLITLGKMDLKRFSKFRRPPAARASSSIQPSLSCRPSW